MKYSTFEELPVWQASVRFALNVFELSNKADFRGLGDTKSQLERASLSISNNIAEGFERGTTNDLITFLYIARGSAGEARSMLRICESVERFSDLKFEISNLIKQAINISKQLHGWLESLKNSDIKGVRYFNEKARKRIETDKEFAEFDRQMSEFRQEFERKLRAREL